MDHDELIPALIDGRKQSEEPSGIEWQTCIAECTGCIREAKSRCGLAFLKDLGDQDLVIEVMAVRGVGAFGPCPKPPTLFLQIEVYEQPQPGMGVYARRTDYLPGQKAPLTLSADVKIEVDVAEIVS